MLMTLFSFRLEVHSFRNPVQMVRWLLKGLVRIQLVTLETVLASSHILFRLDVLLLDFDGSVLHSHWNFVESLNLEQRRTLGILSG